MDGTAQPVAHPLQNLSARSHHVITGRHAALMAAIAEWLDVTPDATSEGAQRPPVAWGNSEGATLDALSA